jgi:hypothetical protein
MVIACRDLHSHCAFVSVGDALVVHVERERGTDAVSHFAGRVEDAAGALLATAAMTLVHGAAPPPE